MSMTRAAAFEGADQRSHDLPPARDLSQPPQQQQQISVTSPSAGSPAQPQPQMIAAGPQQLAASQQPQKTVTRFDQLTTADPAQRVLHGVVSSRTKELQLYDDASSDDSPLIISSRVLLSSQPTSARTRSSTANMATPAAATQALPAQATTTAQTSLSLTGGRGVRLRGA